MLSGETGAGKSILLDALSLVIGGRGETGLIRQKKDQAVVTASFEIKNHNMLKSYLKEIEVDFQEIEQDGLILRRVIKREGSSRAFLNDRPISVNALKGIGELLVEIQGQFDAHGLMRTSGHRQFLDLFANHSALLNAVREKFLYWENCKNRFETAKLELKQSIEEQEFLEFSLNELVVLSIKDGEEEELAELRSSLTDAEKKEMRAALKEEVLTVAKQIGAMSQFKLLVIDTENKFVSTGMAKEIAEAAGGKYHFIPKASADAIGTVASQAVQSLKASNNRIVYLLPIPSSNISL